MALVDILFPRKCLACGRKGRYVCRGCLASLKILKQLCPYCEKASIDGLTHAKCLKKLSINGVYSLWPYEGVIREAILKLKYRFARKIAEELSEYIYLFFKDVAVFPKGSILTPIPLYWLRENFRGFNQSEIIAKMLAEKLGWSFEEGILLRRKLRQPQTMLKGKKRRENIRGVFVLNPKYKSTLSKSYILFDDVYTTGSTLKEAAKVLKRNGASLVWGLTIAR